MRRIKVVSEPTDLVPILRAFDTDVKRDVFKRLIDNWSTTAAIEKEFGADGVEALKFFEKTKLVETRWEAVQGGTDKAYHSYYTSFHINSQCPVQDVAEILSVAAMPADKFQAIEAEIEAMLAKEETYSARAITEKLGIPLIRLRSLIKRSSKFELKGHLVTRMS